MPVVMQKDSLGRLHRNELKKFDEECEAVMDEYLEQASITQQEMKERHQQELVEEK